eukprot:Gregarina_sp_Poly_1__7581@NODE_424_length_8623_cov_277_194483_g343_i1_p3_GENE_NODE_424_length_8623_cov_277_194483_g343_i1NODE_424_length_8623_cov_277_194483_g343_i1_p3_ORF_typecomplete_len306_score44_24DUF4763/PF15960_5/5_4e02DUF4763/PF15960_5/0_0005GCP_N_terminal/PF17681_1/1_5e03GCP_N_terminal/PF17681_1/0_035Atg14/PF10186_9/0_052DUF1043/PF06295_12/0_23DASH_Spc34/PF08657_10/1_4DASH_Spc34/PF08657_10/0_56ATPsynt_ab_C/PF00306_27/0_66ZapB/PF06005_12/33HAUS5/PF14817_6/4_8DUF641/PF04859_12/1_6e02DUF64
MAKWTTPIKIAAEVINDVIQCGNDCTSLRTPISDNDRQPRLSSVNFSRRQHPKLFTPLLEASEIKSSAASESTESVRVSFGSVDFWQDSKCGRTGFREACLVREDPDSAAVAELSPAIPQAPMVVAKTKGRRTKSEHNPQRKPLSMPEDTKLIDIHQQSPEIVQRLPHLVRTLNKYLYKTEKQRQEISSLKRENESYREMIALAEYRIHQSLETIAQLNNSYRRVDEFVRQRQNDLLLLQQRQRHMNHDAAVMEELFSREKHALLMLRGHVSRVFHADMSAGSGETTLQNLCIAIMHILAAVPEF